LCHTKDNLRFYSPNYVFEELKQHTDKLLKLTQLNYHELETLKGLIMSRLTVVDISIIPPEYWEVASSLVSDIDPDDEPFVALALVLDASLWTGDKKLISGLESKNVSLTITTAELDLFLLN
jgi:predicted nucleic acid-binding protein